MGIGTSWVGLALPVQRGLQRALIGETESLGELSAAAGFDKGLTSQGDKK